MQEVYHCASGVLGTLRMTSPETVTTEMHWDCPTRQTERNLLAGQPEVKYL